MKKIIWALALLPALALAACTNPQDASRRALLGMGMTDIQTHQVYFSFACSKGDDWSVNFTAKGFTGQPVSGTVCGGYIGKGATVRFD